MTVLFFTRFFYPHIGGVETHVLEVSKRLAKEGNRVIILTEENRGAENADIKQKGIEVHRIPAGGDDWFKKFRIWSRMFRHQIIIRQADIIHCHDVFFWYLPFRFLFPFKRIYTTFHGYETKFPPARAAILVRKVSEKLSNGNICVGKYIEKWYGTKATIITYGGVSKTQNVKPKTQNKNPKLKIVFVGRIEKDTGIPLYLETLSLLKRKGIKFDFTAVGDGSLRRDAEKFGSVTGFVSDAEERVGDADIIFASSYLSMLSALAAGKIVVSAYDNPLKKDYLLQSPFADFIIASDSGAELAKQIENILVSATLRQKMIDEGRAWAKGQTWEKVTEQYLQLWGKKQFRL